MFASSAASLFYRRPVTATPKTTNPSHRRRPRLVTQPPSMRRETSMSPLIDGRDLWGIVTLVIDDDVNSIQLLVAAFEPFGVRVLTARTAAEAKATLTTITPDVVISDLMLPGEDGIQLIQWLRSRPGAERGTIPAIAVTCFEPRRLSRRLGYVSTTSSAGAVWRL